MREELQQIDQRTRKLMMKHKALPSRDDIDRLYVSRKEGRRGLISIENSIAMTTQRLHKKEQRKANYSDQKQHEQHKDQQNNNNSKTILRRKAIVRIFQATNKKTRTWLKKGSKRESESVLIVPQKDGIITNYVKEKLDKTQQNSKCWLCGDRQSNQSYNM